MENTETSNIIDIRTGQSILPKKVRGALLGAYVESKHNDDSAETFISKFEQRLIGDLAMAAAKVTKDFIKDLKEGK